MPSLWNPHFKLVLASKSAARRHLLESAGLPFETDAAGIDERAIEAAFFEGGGEAEQLAAELARAKALRASERHGGALCLGADQVLALAGQLLHKPSAIEDAASQLMKLSGRAHRLISAFAIAKDGHILHSDEDRAEMTMRWLDEAKIANYLRAAGHVALSSVGGYQIEGLGVHLFERVEGDHTTIMGLPMFKLLARLRETGAVTL
jgi:septum formation protein